MSVFTLISDTQCAELLKQYDCGALTRLQGIEGGITNSLYLVTTTSGQFVLTLFEALTPFELTTFIKLMKYFSSKTIPCPKPISDRFGETCHELAGKPCVLTAYLPGEPLSEIEDIHCLAVGEQLARLHIASLEFDTIVSNPRDLFWQLGSLQKLSNVLETSELECLQTELSYQAQQADKHLDLPSGIIHADLFRDNVLFKDNQLTGLLDLYYACSGYFIYDVAIVINDWCVDPNGQLNKKRMRALMEGYESIRPFEKEELPALNDFLRLAACRFWISRLLDYHFQKSGEMVRTLDPTVYQRILTTHCQTIS